MLRWRDTLLDFEIDSERVADVRLPVAEPLVRLDRPTDWRAPRVFVLSAMLHVLFVVAAHIAPAPVRAAVPRRFVFDTAPERPATYVRTAPAPVASPGGDPTASVLDDLRVNRRPAETDGAVGTLRELREALSSPIFTNGGIDESLDRTLSGLRPSAAETFALSARRRSSGVGSVDIGVLDTGPVVSPPGIAEPIFEPVVLRPIISCGCWGNHRDEILRVIRRALRRFQYCYERELVWHPLLGGKVVTAFTVDEDGGVTNASTVSSTMDSPSVEGCLRRVFRTLRFPRPRHGDAIEVRYPIIFETAG